MRNLGPTGKKILLLLEGGFLLGLTGRPDAYFKLTKNIAKEWEKINKETLRRSIGSLYKSKLVDYRENKDGTVKLQITEGGKNKILKYDLDKIEIKKPPRWDGLWRIVIFDIPETHQKGRRAIAAKLKELGFYPLQKSVFIHPYECKDEIDFINEIFETVPYVRFIRTKDIDISIKLEKYFKLN